MAKEFSRSQRVAEQIRRELADLLQFEVKDPRVGKVTLTEVEVTGDLAHAKVYFVTQNAADDAVVALGKAAGFLRSQLSKRLLLRSVPQLHFVYDVSLDRGMRMSQLIDQAITSDKH
ncbi:MAG: ribosome-binding factor A [Methylophilales bacterium RIFCSPHIGHO2_02_FULL_57_10]|nr:MAG: ribosome-binding factor A [Methylophilales bacterium RIFCSPHIGHO2_02_FULL_57_10]